MESAQLKAAQGGGVQNQTVSQGSLAQSAPEGDPGGTPIGQVQPSASSNSLAPTSGISLNNTVLPGVRLNLAPTTAATAKTTQAPTKAHHVNATWFVLPLLIVVIALVTTWQATRAEKNTTLYR